MTSCIAHDGPATEADQAARPSNLLACDSQCQTLVVDFERESGSHAEDREGREMTGSSKSQHQLVVRSAVKAASSPASQN